MDKEHCDVCGRCVEVGTGGKVCGHDFLHHTTGEIKHTGCIQVLPCQACSDKDAEIADLKAERDKLAEERDEYKRAEAEKYKFYQYELDRANKVQTKADRYERVLRELERDLLADELTFLNAPDRRVSTETLLDTTQLRHDWLRAKLPELFGSEKGGE
jgi:hypothetical protein